MKRTKQAAILCAALCTAGLFASCMSTQTYKDGSYEAKFKEPDDHGWTEYVKVTVKDDKISAVEFDALDEKGAKKTEDEAYKDAYTGAGYTTYPADYTKKLEDHLLSTQTPEKVDTVAGATHSSDSFKELVKKLEPSMKSGKTETVLVEKLK